MAKTQEELDKEAKEQQQSWLGWIWEHLGDFLTWGGLLAVLAFCAQTDWGQKLLGKLIGEDNAKGIGDKIKDGLGGLVGMLPESWQKFLGMEDAVGKALDGMNATQARAAMVKQEMPEAIANIIAADDTTWKGFVATARAANGGKISQKGQLTNANTLFALLTTTNPSLQAMVQNLIPAVAAQAPSADGKPSKMKTDILAAVKDIISNDTRLNTLMSDANRKPTLALLMSFMPKNVSVSVDALDAAIKSSEYAADGTLKPDFKTALVNALTDDAGMTALSTRLLGDLSATPEGKHAADQVIVSAAAPAVGEKNAPLIPKLLSDLGSNSQTFVSLMQAPTPDPVAIEAFVKQNLAPFKAFADAADLSAIPSEAVRTQLEKLKSNSLATITAAVETEKTGVSLNNDLLPLFAETDAQGKTTPLPMEAIIANLLHKENRDIIKKAGVKNVVSLLSSAATGPEKALLTEKNLEAFLAAAETMAKSPQTLQQVLPVLSAFIALANGDTSAFAQLSPDQVAAFFSDHNNDQAISILLNQLDVPPQKKAVITSLQAHFGNWDKGLAEVLADKESVTVLLNCMKGEKPVSGWDYMSHTGYWGKSDAEIMNVYLEAHAPAKLQENAKEMEAVISDLAKAGVSLTGPAPKPAPSTNTNIQGYSYVM